jgi:phosphate acyltransferase
VRIGIDAMGGDRAPVMEVRGAIAARQFLQNGDRLVLVGDQEAVRQQLQGHDGWQDFIELHHAEQVITMDDPPVEALRTKPRSSLVVMSELHAEGKIDACISAGNTGACVAAAQMRLRRLRGVHRPGIAIITPTLHGPVAICDVGANVQCRPQHLHQYAVMASLYIKTICGIEKPRVGLLSVGEEDAKGNDLVKGARELLKDDPFLNFAGNVEGRDVFRGACDVVVCDGFVGNVILKLMEGMAGGLIKAMIAELSANMPTQIDLIKKSALAIKTKYDFNEYGGAPLLGVNGICIICHGASDDRGIANAVRVARTFGKYGVNQQITACLMQHQGEANE